MEGLFPVFEENSDNDFVYKRDETNNHSSQSKLKHSRGQGNIFNSKKI